MLRILVVEDEAHNRAALLEILKRMGHEVVLATDGQEALEQTSRVHFDLVMSDVRMPRMDGLQFFDAFRQLHGESTPFVFMTAYGRIEDAVAAMRKGALHFLNKPLKKKDISAVVEEVEKVCQSRERSVDLSSSFSDEAVYVSRAFTDVVQMVDRVAASLASVLFVGESGTGKEVLAQRLHKMSARSDKPFVAFHAGAMPESLLESELFGHEKGAFTGAESARIGQIRSASGGTFFIDELATMPLGVQTKLLRVIQERSVTPLGETQPVECDVRWVAATNQELEPLVAAGKFREDLLYRLRVVVVEIPPLRERPEDIDVLLNHFISEFAVRDSRMPLSISEAVRDVLRGYSWPGNVRELRNTVERAMVLASGDELTVELLPPHIAQIQRAREIRIAVGTSLQSVEDRLIEETLRLCDGDKSRAASILGVAPRTIYRWLEKRELAEKQ